MGSIGGMIKHKIKTWLDIQELDGLRVSIQNGMDFETNAMKNRIWYHGNANEISKMYEALAELRPIDRQKFWAAACTEGIEIQKRHTGLPGIVVDMLSDIVIADFNGFTFSDEKGAAGTWEDIAKDNAFTELLEEAVKKTLYIGDGAFKLSIDKDISDYPIIEFWPGDRIEIVLKRGRLREIIFKSIYRYDSKKYELNEVYGYGYVRHELYLNDKKVPLDTIPNTSELEDITFDGCVIDDDGNVTTYGSYMLGQYIRFGKSERYDGRGSSIFDRKEDSFDSLDEAWSQWMDALRSGRTKQYIPDCLIPRDPETGKFKKPNAFDNRFIKTSADMTEGATNKITTETPTIQHESYLAAYTTALDLCLQGIISPSTLGIDVKKLDNSEAQREKEKATLYTRQKIVNMLENALPELVNIVLKTNANMGEGETIDTEIKLNFGEYANPSFESQVETIGKAKSNGIMSTEASIDELYGDSKDENWKKTEVRRIKEEQGIAQVQEPALNLEGVDLDEI